MTDLETWGWYCDKHIHEMSYAVESYWELYSKTVPTIGVKQCTIHDCSNIAPHELKYSHRKDNQQIMKDLDE